MSGRLSLTKDFRTRSIPPRRVEAPGTALVIRKSELEFFGASWVERGPLIWFPAEKVGASGDIFEAKVYATDPLKPIGDIKEAWESAKKRTRRHCPKCKGGILADKSKPEKGYVCIECEFEVAELPPGLIMVRFHDLRHSAVSRMIAARVPLPMIAKIVGWSAGTMAKMAARYGHFGIEELRDAVEAINGGSAHKSAFNVRSLEFSLESEDADEGSPPN